MIITEFDSGNALVELQKVLPYTYICHSEKVTYDICELSAVCSEFEGKLKTQTYLSDLRNLAKLTGQDYAEVLKGVISLLGQSIHKLSDSSEVKTLPDVSDGMISSVPSVTPPAQLPSAAFYGLQGATASAQDEKEEFPHVHPDPAAQHGAMPRPSLPAMSLPDLNPHGVQRYVVEHIVKE